MSIASPIASEAEILAAVVAPDEPGLPPELSRLFLSFHFSDDQIARMHELADKNNKGTISSEERQQMENYARVGNFLSLMKSKARLSLKASGESQ